MSVKISDTIERTSSADFVKGAAFANEAARLAAGQGRYTDLPVVQKDNATFWLIKPLAQCFLADGVTPATNRATWGTLNAHWTQLADVTMLGKLNLVDVPISATNGIYQLPANVRGKRFVLGAGQISTTTKILLPAAYETASLDGVFGILLQTASAVPNTIYGTFANGSQIYVDELEPYATGLFLAKNESVAGSAYTVAHRVGGKTYRAGKNAVVTANGEISVPGGVFLGDFVANTKYYALNQIVNPDGILVAALADFTSTSTYVAANWRVVITPGQNANPDLTSLQADVQKLKNLVGDGNPDADAIINKLSEVYAFVQGMAEGPGALLAQLNAMQQAITTLQNAGPGGLITRANLDPTLLSQIDSPNFSLPLGFGLDAEVDAANNNKLTLLKVNKADIDDEVREILSSIGGLPTWAKPVLTPFDDTDILAMSSPGAMEYCFGTDTANLHDIGAQDGDHFSGTYQMGNFDRVEGYIQVRTKQTNEKAASGFTKSPAFHAALNNSAPNLILASENMNAMPPWSIYQGGYYEQPTPQIADPLGGNTMWVVTVYDKDAKIGTNAVDMVIGDTYSFKGVFSNKPVDGSSTPGLPAIRLESLLAHATIDLTTGVASSIQNATVYVKDLSSQGPDWASYFSVEFNFVASNASQGVEVYMPSPNGNKCRVWHFQLTHTPRAGAYNPTTA